MATTVDSVGDELELLEVEGYEPDLIVLREILDIDCNEFHILEYLVYDME